MKEITLLTSLKSKSSETIITCVSVNRTTYTFKIAGTEIKIRLTKKQILENWETY